MKQSGLQNNGLRKRMSSSLRNALVKAIISNILKFNHSLILKYFCAMWSSFEGKISSEMIPVKTSHWLTPLCCYARAIRKLRMPKGEEAASHENRNEKCVLDTHGQQGDGDLDRHTKSLSWTPVSASPRPWPKQIILFHIYNDVLPVNILFLNNIEKGTRIG